MKKLAGILLATTLLTTPALAEDVKLGVILGFTGPIESLTPDMAAGAEFAMKEVADAGGILGGGKVEPVRADSTCVDAAAAQTNAERLITSEGVKGIMGADCSGVTTAILNNVAKPQGMVMISPSATSPALSTIEDDDVFFRTAPSDARAGEILAQIMIDKGVKSAAMTYTNNDYGKGISDSIRQNFEKLGGKITISSAHEDGKGDYAAEVGELAQAGGDVLIVAGYLDQGGKGIIQSALDTGAFSTFVLPDGMIGDSLPAAIGEGLNGSYGSIAGSDAPGANTFKEMFEKTGAKAGSYTGESYDAAALMLLAMEAAKSSDPKVYKTKIMDLANEPGEKIFPGELKKALEIVREGGDIDYEGATGVELVGPGESAGSFREIEIKDGKIETVKYR